MVIRALTSGGILLADPSVLAGVVVAGPRPAAAPVHPKHPPAPRARPLCGVGRNDRLAVELQAPQAADKIRWGRGGPWGGGPGGRSEEQGAAGAHHAARLGQGGGGRVALVQGQPQSGGVDLQQDAVPAAV